MLFSGTTLTTLTSEPLRARRARWIGIGVFLVAVLVYGSRMATSFVWGDTADYLSRAHWVQLSVRGNGLPVYLAMLAATVRIPAVGGLTDGFYANALSVLIGAASVLFTYLAALRWTRSLGAALTGATCLLVSGLVWSNAVWIMPHITLAAVSALSLWLLTLCEDSMRRGPVVALGLALGMSFGLLPTSLVLLPSLALFVILVPADPSPLRRSVWLAAGLTAGVLGNIALITAFELHNPVRHVGGESLPAAVLAFLRGGDERGWFLRGLSGGHLIRGWEMFPRAVAADFEIFGSLLAVGGLATMIRRRRLWALATLGGFGAIACWVGVYPGDTRLLHGLGAYPIAALWVSAGAAWLLDRSGRRRRLAAVLPLLILANIAVGTVTYRRAICHRDGAYASWLCMERVPQSNGDDYLRRTEAALERIPEGSVVFGAAWDSAAQMNYLLLVRHRRPDLESALDLSKLNLEEFLAIAEPEWSAARPVLLYGDWKDVGSDDPRILDHVRGVGVREALYEMWPAGGAQ